ncbi:complexin-like [Montipora foliosa]|uniref:complexin-like n=1 Tax=Montipora foliosa TaxID=591990 RepID=UPI0035F20CD3
MNSIAKAAVSSKFSSVSRSLGFDDKDSVEGEGPSAKELPKFKEENDAARAKLQEQHAKRHAEREKKREEIRVKYGIREELGKGNQSRNTRRNTNEIEKEDTGVKKMENSGGEEKQC